MALVVTKAELIKWADALDIFLGRNGCPNVEDGLRMARLCEHPDAKWLVSRFPKDNVTREAVRLVMEAEGNDVRALYVAWSMGPDPCEDLTLLTRAGLCAGSGRAGTPGPVR
jgi:hypothetical protein